MLFFLPDANRMKNRKFPWQVHYLMLLLLLNKPKLQLQTVTLKIKEKKFVKNSANELEIDLTFVKHSPLFRNFNA